MAHEIGHALQDHQGYAPLKLRGAIVPAVQVSAWVAPIMFFIGLLVGLTQLAWLGVHLLRGQARYLRLITLPVEFDASRRACACCRPISWRMAVSCRAPRSVLHAAALTYVAALAQTLATMLYYVSTSEPADEPAVDIYGYRSPIVG